MNDIESLISNIHLNGLAENKKHNKIISSLYNQTFRKKLGLTSRQIELAKTILDEYASHFDNAHYNTAISNTRLGVREIDRTRSISLIDNEIAVRFRYSHKVLKGITAARKTTIGHRYDNYTHFFPATHKNLYAIISNLTDLEFKIDDTLLETYAQIKEMHDNPQKYVPYVEIGKISNLNNIAKNALVKELGEPNAENIHLYQDRSVLYGTLVNTDQSLAALANKTRLTNLIANRSMSHVNLLPDEFSLNEVFNTLNELDRFPLLIVLDDASALQQLKHTHSSMNGIVNNSDISVLYRCANKGIGIEYNEYVKSNKINNLLDNNTKVLYTIKNKLQKPILKENIQVKSVLLSKSSRLHSKLENYVTSADLIIHYDNYITTWRSIHQRTEPLRRINANVQIKNI